MTEDQREKILRRAIDTFGIDRQIDKFAEEASELIKALMKWKHASGDGSDLIELGRNVIEEIVDTQIVLKQLMMGLVVDDEIYTEIEDKKLARLEKLLDEIGAKDMTKAEVINQLRDLAEVEADNSDYDGDECSRDVEVLKLVIGLVEEMTDREWDARTQ